MCRRPIPFQFKLWSAPFLAVAVALLLSSCATIKVEPPPLTGVQISSLPGKLAVSIAGQPFTEYHFTDTPKPYLYPLLGPTGAAMTRNFPMASPPGEEHDHPHHRSLWFGHGLVNGIDFWTEKAGTGRIVHDRFTGIRGGQEKGIIRSRNKWIAPDGKIVCTDERSLTFFNGGPTVRMLDFEITLNADHGELVFGDTKEGTMAVRVAETMRLTQPAGTLNPESHIVNSEGAHDTEAWGKRAKWCDYSGLVDGKLVGIAILDHPKNPRYPTWWMARDYGLLGANPFGQHEFEKLSNENVGDLKIPAGQSVTFRYRFVLHTGTAEEARLAERFEQFAAEPKEAR
jgi:hypothetical protein